MSKIEIINKMAKKQLEEIINDIDVFDTMYVTEERLSEKEILDSRSDIDKLIHKIEEVREVL